MNLKTLSLALAGATMALSGCATDGYGGFGGGYGYGSAISYGSPYGYDGWYDGYYGSIYGGYWGSDDYFYYRNRDSDRRFRRADRNHFMRGAPQGQHNFRQQQGEFRPREGMRMPQFRGGRTEGWQGQRQDRGPGVSPGRSGRGDGGNRGDGRRSNRR